MGIDVQIANIYKKEIMPTLERGLINKVEKKRKKKKKKMRQ